MVKLRPIAIHLPQYHPIPENDQWWGRGFTEWTNVTRARPLFKGHFQPNLPADLGFYDLRLSESREAQAALAKEYGIYGFCYYHYWFHGRKILERPVEEILKSGKPDFPFMLCWANENWTRTWDGGNKEILIQQQYSFQDDLEHIRYLIPFFKDPRYIRIAGKPVFAIYRSGHFPNIDRTLSIWREECFNHGLELYLCRFETLGEFGLPHLKTFDAAVEFQPSSEILQEYAEINFSSAINSLQYRLRYRWSKLFNRTQAFKSDFRLGAYRRLDYNKLVDFVAANYVYPTTYKRFPGVMPSWDNTPRRPQSPLILTNSNPASYKRWLKFHKDNFQPFGSDDNLIFINAWNEWAEGNYLEPCQRWGRAYLEATKQGLSE